MQVAAAAGNIANLDTDGYQAQRVNLATADDGQGVQVASVTRDTSPGSVRPDTSTTTRDSADISEAGRTMWYLYRENYPDSLKAASRFLDAYPQSDLAPRATEVAIAAFEKMATDRLARKDYARLVEAWRANPVIAANRNKLSDQTRLGLALALLRDGSPRDALAEALPFIGPKESDNGNMATSWGTRIITDHGRPVRPSLTGA